MTFIVPASFTVFEVPQRDRPPCLIECEVVELVRTFAQASWKFRRLQRRGIHATYLAFVRLPAWVVPPDGWPRLDSGEVELRVPLHLNPRVPIPQFPAGSNRVRVDDVLQLRGEPC